MEETEERIVADEKIRDQHRSALQTAETELATARVRLEEMLSDIPEEHREATRLAELITSRADVLTRRKLHERQLAKLLRQLAKPRYLP